MHSKHMGVFVLGPDVNYKKGIYKYLLYKSGTEVKILEAPYMCTYPQFAHPQYVKNTKQYLRYESLCPVPISKVVLEI